MLLSAAKRFSWPRMRAAIQRYVKKCLVCQRTKAARHKPYGLLQPGARRRRSDSGLGGGCARMPVGTYLYLHAGGAGNPIAVPSLAR
jgi:hypothetical protein